MGRALDAIAYDTANENNGVTPEQVREAEERRLEFMELKEQLALVSRAIEESYRRYHYNLDALEAESGTGSRSSITEEAEARMLEAHYRRLENSRRRQAMAQCVEDENILEEMYEQIAMQEERRRLSGSSLPSQVQRNPYLAPPANPYMLASEGAPGPRLRLSDFSNLSSNLSAPPRTGGNMGSANYPIHITSVSERRQRLIDMQRESPRTVSDMLRQQETLARAAQASIAQRAREFSERNSARLSSARNSANVRLSANAMTRHS